MENLTFAEQVKIILSRKGMTIKELAQLIEERTGKRMSRQNLTQRLGRDNFQEQDMRMIAAILGCPFSLSIMGRGTEEPDRPVVRTAPPRPAVPDKEQPAAAAADGKEAAQESVEMTVGDLYRMTEELDALEQSEKEKKEAAMRPKEQYRQGAIFLRRDGVPVENEAQEEDGARPADTEEDARNKKPEPAAKNADEGENLILGEKNPYTGHEYQSNTVRSHPSRIGYVQVYDRRTHKWTDMTEWAFLGYQERKKKLLGKDYEPPIYLD